jgi:acyl-CoA synthetase (AMP-forming)/AMP-acid ligase II
VPATKLLGDLAHRGERLWGDRDAFVWQGRRRTYAELADRVPRTAALLEAAGVGAGTRIATLSTNVPEAIELCLAASLVGAVIVPLNVRLTPDDLRYQLDDAGVTHGLVHPLLSPLAEGSGLADRQVWHVGDDLDDRLARVEPRSWNAPRPDDGVPWIHLYTSGTTGKPKGCLLSQRAWLASNANLAHAMALGADDRLLGVFPFFHVAGFGLALSTLTVGGCVVVPGSADATELWSLVEEHDVTIGAFPGLKAALDVPGKAPSLRVLFGGANMESTKTLDLLAEVVPTATFRGVYGSTEAGNFVTLSTGDEERERPGTIGRPLFGFDVAILGEGDEELPAGEPGELGLRGPSTMLGYWGLPEASAEALRNGWLHTGDVMRLDGHGFLYFVDRSKDMIKPGGENVYSIEVETALLQHPAVVDCAVVGVPDTRWGEAVKAIVVLAAGQAVSADELDAHCRTVLAGYKRPRWYELTDTIPRSPIGKIVKKDLREAHDPATAIRLPERT